MSAPIPRCTGSAAGDGLSVVQRTLCDTGTDPQTCFLRTEVYDGTTLVGSFDTLADGVTPYVPVGPVEFSCDPDSDPYLVQQRREDFAGAFVWNRPANVLSVTVKCRALGAAGSVTVTDAAATVSELFVGDEETWTAPPGALLDGTFTITGTLAGDVVTVLWTEEV
jgi:hypothetical protein